MKKNITNIFDVIFLTRPMLLVPVWGFALLGYGRSSVVAGSKINLFNFGNEIYLPFIKIILFSLSVGVVNIFNQLEDVEADKANGGFPLLLKINISKKNIIIFALFLIFLSTLLPLLLGWNRIALLSLLSLIIGYFYSFRPFYFTGRPFVDFISNAIGFGIVAFAVGWISFLPIDIIFFKNSFVYFLLMVAGSISSTIPDIKGDKIGGKNTTAIFLGDRYSHLLATIIIILAGAYAFYLNDRVAFTSAMFSFPIYIAYIIIKKEIFMEATYKVGGGMLMLLIALIYPIFIPFSLLTLLVTIIYFRLRFSVTYPSLIPNGDK